MHSDIKPDNILVKSTQDSSTHEIRIADMGLAAFTLQDELLEMKCGTPGYVAPEVFTKSGYEYKADIFSLGSCFFNLLTGCLLFGGRNAEEILRRNMECKTERVPAALESVSAPCKDLLLKMINKDPA